MGQGSSGFYDDSEDYSQADELPLNGDDRASQSLREPSFQLPREDDSVTSEAERAPADDAAPKPEPPQDTGSGAQSSPVVQSGRAPSTIRSTGDEEVGGALTALGEAPPTPQADAAMQSVPLPPQQMQERRLYSPREVATGAARQDALMRQQDAQRQADDDATWRDQYYRGLQKQDATAQGDYEARQAGLYKYLHGAGIQVETGPDGSPRVATDAGGNPVWQPVASKPFQDDSGNWVKRVRGSDGKVQDINLVDAGEYRVDPKTADRYVSDGAGQRINIGKDEPTLQRLHVAAQKTVLNGQNRQDMLDYQQLQPAYQQLQSQVKLMQAATANPDGNAENDMAPVGTLEKSIRQTMLDPTSKDLNSEAGKQLADMQQSYQKYLAAHPDYAEAKTALATAQAVMAQKKAAILSRRQSALMLSTNPNAPAVGSLASPVYSDPASPGVQAGQTTADHVQVMSGASAAAAGTTQLTALDTVKQRLQAMGVQVPHPQLPPPAAPSTNGKDPSDNGVGGWQNFVGQMSASFKDAGTTMVAALDRLYAPAYGLIDKFTGGTLANEAMSTADVEEVKRKYLQDFQAGNADKDQSNPYGKGGAEDLSKTINPAMANSFTTGIAHMIPGVAAMASGALDPALPEMYFVSNAAAEGSANAGDSGSNRLLGAAEGAAITYATLKAFGGSGKLAKIALANRLVSPASRLIAGTALAGGMNTIIDGIVTKLTGGSFIPQTPAEWAQRGIFNWGFGARSGWDGSKLPERLQDAQNQIALSQKLLDSGKLDPATTKLTTSQIADMQKLLDDHAGLVKQMNGEQPDVPKTGTPAAAEQTYRDTLKSLDDLRGKYTTATGNNDVDQAASFVDQATDAGRTLHGIVQDRIDAIPEDARRTIGKAVDSTNDVEANEGLLRQNPNVAFAAESIGSDPEVRQAYVEPEKEARISKFVDGQQDPQAAAKLVDRHVGLAAARDLWTIASGGAIPQERAEALSSPAVGLLERATDTAGNPIVRVTTDGVSMLTPGQRAGIAKLPDRFRVSDMQGTQTPGSVFHSHVRSGQERGVQLFSGSAKKAPAPTRHAVDLTMTPRGAAEPVTRTVPVKAASEPEAMARAVIAGQKNGHAVHDAQVVPPEELAQRAKNPPAPIQPPEAKVAPKSESAPVAETRLVAPSAPEQPKTPWKRATGTDYGVDGRRAVQAIQSVFGKNAGLFKALGVDSPMLVRMTDRRASGLAVQKARLLVDGDLLHNHMSNIGGGMKALEWAKHALTEELIHVAQTRAAERAGVHFETFYTDLFHDPALPADLVTKAREAYGPGWDKLGDAARGAEVVRMVVQRRWTGTITERVFRAVQHIVDFLHGLSTEHGNSELLRQAIQQTEGVLNDAQKQASHYDERSITSRGSPETSQTGQESADVRPIERQPDEPGGDRGDAKASPGPQQPSWDVNSGREPEPVRPGSEEERALAVDAHAKESAALADLAQQLGHPDITTAAAASNRASDFAQQVKLAAIKVPESKLFGPKVFIHHIWEEWKKMPGNSIPLEEFKQAAMKEIPRGNLSFNRADLPFGFSKQDLTASKMQYGSEEYNFMTVPGMGGEPPLMRAAESEEPTARDYRYAGMEAVRDHRQGNAIAPRAMPGEERQRIIDAYQHEVQRTGFPATKIADVLEQAGYGLHDRVAAKSALAELHRAGDVVALPTGDWSASSDRERAWSMPTRNESDFPSTMMRMAAEHQEPTGETMPAAGSEGARQQAEKLVQDLTRNGHFEEPDAVTGGRTGIGRIGRGYTAPSGNEGAPAYGADFPTSVRQRDFSTHRSIAEARKGFAQSFPDESNSAVSRRFLAVLSGREIITGSENFADAMNRLRDAIPVVPASKLHSLKMLDEASTSQVYVDRKGGAAYKLVRIDDDGNAGGFMPRQITVRPADDTVIIGGDKKIPALDLLNAVAISNVHGAPVFTEVAGVTPDGDLILKQPYIKGLKPLDYLEHPEQMEAALKQLGLVKLSDMGSYSAVGDVNGRQALFDDLHGENVMLNAKQVPYLVDSLASRILTPNEQILVAPYLAERPQPYHPPGDDMLPAAYTGELAKGDRLNGEPDVKYDGPLEFPGMEAHQFTDYSPISKGATFTVRGEPTPEKVDAKLGALRDRFSAPVLPAAGSLADHMRALGDAVRTIFTPAERGMQAQETALTTREHTADQAAANERAYAQLKGESKRMAKIPEAERVDFMDNMEHGRRQATPELDAVAKPLRDMFDRLVQDVRSLGTGALKNVVTNYFPHIWKDPKAAGNFISSFYGKRPLEGGKAFLKQRTIPTIKDGMSWRVNDADGDFVRTAPDEATAKSDAAAIGGSVGKPLELVTTNPVDLALLKSREMLKYITAHRILNELRGRGLVRFVKATEKAPDGWRQIDDRIGTVYGPSEAQGLGKDFRAQHGVADTFVNAQTIRGRYYMPEEAARVLNNYLSPGLAGNPLFDVARSTGNMMNMVQLGLSAFHLTGVTLNSVISKSALAIKQAFDGEFGKALGTAVRVPIAPFDALATGSKVLAEMIRPGTQGASIAELANAVIKAGGRGKMDAEYQTGQIKKFFDAWKEGRKGAALLRTPLAALEAFGHPLMAEFVPRVKLGVFADAAKYELSRLPANADVMTQRKALAEVWDSVDNRFGQMAYDNLFWHKTFKDALMLGTRSVGWNWGTIRELGGGASDLLKAPFQIGKGNPVTHRLAYSFALPATVAMMGALYQYLHTGKGPDTLADYFNPKTGRNLPDGTEERVNLPTYWKDVRSYSTHPFSTLGNKVHPLFAALGQMIANKDYYGTQITAPDDPLYKRVAQEAEFAAKQFVPFSVAGGQQREGQTPLAKVENVFGITPAPADTYRTPAMTYLHDYHTAMAPAERTADQAAKQQARHTLLGHLQSRDMTLQDSINKAKAAGLDVPTIKNIMRESRMDPKLIPFHGLPLEIAERAYKLGTPEEQRIWRQALLAKRTLSAKRAVANR